ncbi:hypothetical protein F443_23149, partial [Phytophthora nicotianae P1569]
RTSHRWIAACTKSHQTGGHLSFSIRLSMQLSWCRLFSFLASVLIIIEAVNCSPKLDDRAPCRLRDKRLRRQLGEGTKPTGVLVEGSTKIEERGVFSTIKENFSEFKAIINKMKPHNRALTKMEKMFRRGVTPENLEQRYGSTRKVKLQEEFRQFYRWRSSWQQQRPYPLRKKAGLTLNSAG